jgi:hypothetical protein
MLFGLTALGNVCLALSLAVPDASPAEPLADGRNHALGSHVRGATPKIKTLIESGIRRSPTFAALVDRLNQSDVIVYLSISRDLPSGIDGRLSFMSSAGSLRYLHAQVMEGMGEEAIIAIAAHELQHALEVAANPQVRTSAGMAKLYKRIGERSSLGLERYDTAAARSTGRRVRQELS